MQTFWLIYTIDNYLYVIILEYANEMHAPPFPVNCNVDSINLATLTSAFRTERIQVRASMLMYTWTKFFKWMDRLHILDIRQIRLLTTKQLLSLVKFHVYE